MISYKQEKICAIMIAIFLIVSFAILHAAETWNEATPAATESPTLGDDRIREFKTAIRERLAADHDFEASESPAFGDSGSTIGFHKKVTLVEQSSDPTTQANEAAIYTKDDGSGNTEIYIRGPSSGTVYRFTTSNSTLIEADIVELLKDAGGTSSGDLVTIDDEQTLTNKTLTSPTATSAVLNTAVSGTAVADEDNMASDSNTRVATQQSIKAYVDSGTVTMTNKTLTNPKINEDVQVQATATEINTVADGSTAKNSHTHNLADGAADITATYTEVNQACDGIGSTIPRQTIINIGTWNMDSTAAVNVAHGLTASKIKSVRGYVVNDAGTVRYNFPTQWAGEIDSNIVYWDGTNIYLTRRGGGLFDSTDFDGSGNRGELVIDYVN